VAEIQQIPAEKIVHPARRGDQHLRASADGLQLIPFAESADYDGGPKARARRHFDEGLVDLDGQFTGWTEDSRADAGWRRLGREPLDQRQDKR
jgi:hypothetical protein